MCESHQCHRIHRITLAQVFRTPLLHSDVIDRRHRVDVTNALFGNLPELIALNRRLLSALQSREHPEGSEPDNSSAVNNRSTTTFHIVHAIGDALQQWIDAAAGPYVRYTTTQVMATYILELEMKNNTEFRVFCEQGEENEACRRLAVQSFMRRPMARLGRYPLLLEVAGVAAWKGLKRQPVHHSSTRPF